MERAKNSVVPCATYERSWQARTRKYLRGKAERVLRGTLLYSGKPEAGRPFQLGKL